MKIILFLLTISFYSIANTATDRIDLNCSVVVTISEFSKPYKFIGFSKLNQWCEKNSQETKKVYAIYKIKSPTNKEDYHV